MWMTQAGPNKQRGPFFALLVTLVLFMFLMPLLETSDRESLVSRIGFTGVAVVGIGVALTNRSILKIALGLLAAILAAQWLVSFFTESESTIRLIRNLSSAIYLFYLIVVLARTLGRQRQASMDAVLGGINIYLLLALAFMQLHLSLENLTAGSYLKGGLALSDPASHLQESLGGVVLYFSFTTLTTLGYGDISPATPAARVLCSAEAVIGQLFVAIFIGGLVALWISELTRKAPLDSD